MTVVMHMRILLGCCLSLVHFPNGFASPIQQGPIPVAVSHPRGQSEPPGRPPAAPGRRLIEEFILLIDSGDRKAARSYVGGNFEPAALAEEGTEQRLNVISELHDVTRGVEVHSITETKPGSWAAVGRTKLTGQWVRLAFVVGAQPSPKFKSFAWNYNSPPRGASTTPRRLSDQEIVREFGAFMRKLAGADVFSGSVILARDGKILLEVAYGQANKNSGEPNRVDTKLNLASLNKMFTAVAIAQLAERGKLSFDDPVAKYLPDFPNKEAAEKIRIKHLLTHTSGLGECFNERWYASSRDRFRTIDNYLELVKNEAPAFEPGSRRRYSNTGYMVLGKIVEKVTGQSYFDYVRENIYKRAGMSNTAAYELDRVNKNLAVGYDKEYTDAGVIFRNNLYLHSIKGMPAGGGFSTTEDLLRFSVALRSAKLIDAGSVATMITPKPELNSPNYGYGFGVIPEDGIVAHSGGAEGIGAHLEIHEDGYTFAVLSNYGGAMSPITLKLRELLRAGK